MPGFPGYEVDEHGRVFSLPKQAYANYGVRTYGGRQLKCSQVRGYPVVCLRLAGHAYGVTRYVHTLVLTAFVGPRPKNMEACHRDGDRTNNRLANLRWDTTAANAADRTRHGTAVRGEHSPHAKLTEADVTAIRQRGASIADQAKQYGVSVSLIRKIRSREAWAHVQ